MNSPIESKLTFGIMVSRTPPWKRVVEHAHLVESLGFDKLWLPDHFMYPDFVDQGWYECWSTLAALATQTDKITIGSLVASMTLRNPAVLARTAMTIDHISGGRLELGVGAGGVKTCHTMTGVPLWDRRERSERYAEFVEILDHMLAHRETTYEGKYYNIQQALIHPLPLSSPRPVLNVAAHGDRALRLAATYGDAWNSLRGEADQTPTQTSDTVRQRYPKLCDFAIEAGRDPLQLGRTFLFGWTTDGLFRSLEAFYDTMGRYIEAGINDFAFIYAYGMDSWKDQTITTEDLLRRVALEAIPSLMSKV
jgi:alkanesulfonate monooxygenase SsuD/methylene tetrahydromethanopterin reductase-like flavin-dependent oxidoreductase (luciferase family)